VHFRELILFEVCSDVYVREIDERDQRLAGLNRLANFHGAFADDSRLRSTYCGVLQVQHGLCEIRLRFLYGSFGGSGASFGYPNLLRSGLCVANRGVGLSDMALGGGNGGL
jgi:hypothetical protein